MREIFLGAVGAIAVSSAASAAVLDFEGQSAGDVLTAFTEGPGGVIAATGGSGDAMVFDSENPTGGDTDLGAGFDDPTTGPIENFRPGNILIVSEDGDSSDPDDNAGVGSITFTFDDVVTMIGFDAFDIDDDGLTVTLFDAMDNVLGMLVVGGFDTNGPQNLFRSFAFGGGAGVGGVTRVVFDFRVSGAIDNIRFDAPQVPVPAALPLLLTGLAGLGVASRRRKRT